MEHHAEVFHLHTRKHCCEFIILLNFSRCFRKLQGEAGVVTAIDQADETAKMMPLYDISDEAGQTELLLKELEYAAQVIVDKLEQDGQLSA